MKMSSDDQKGLSVVLLYTALLFFLVGMAGRIKMDFHYREEIFSAGMWVGAILTGLGVFLFLLAWRKKRN